MESLYNVYPEHTPLEGGDTIIYLEIRISHYSHLQSVPIVAVLTSTARVSSRGIVIVI